MDLETFRAELGRWLADHAADLDRFRHLPTDLDGQFAVLGDLQRLLFDAGWALGLARGAGRPRRILAPAGRAVGGAGRRRLPAAVFVRDDGGARPGRGPLRP